MRSAPRRPVRLLVAMAGIVSGCLLAPSLLRALTAAMPSFVARMEDNFTGGTVAPEHARALSRYEPCPDGLCLRPGPPARLDYAVPVPAGAGGATVRFWGQQPAPGSNAISVSADDGRTFHGVLFNANASGERAFDVPVAVQPAGTLIVRVDATNTGVNLAMPVDKLEVVFLSAPPVRLPGTAWVLAMCLAFGLAAVALSRRPALTAVTVGILLLAIAVRYAALAVALERPLDPDAQGYREFASQMSLFSDRGFFSSTFHKREPLWIFVVHAWQRLAGDTAASLKLLTLVLSVAVTGLTIVVGRALTGLWGGWATGLFMAVSLPLAFESSRGLRLELELLLLLAFVGLAFASRRRPGSWRWMLAVGTIAGLLALTRVAYATSLPPLIVLAAFLRRHERGWQWAVPAAGALVVVALWILPVRVSYYKLYGDPFWDTASYARAIANFEFVNQPGFPTMEELQVDASQGPPLTYRDYLFTLHTPADVARGTARGLVALFRNMRLWHLPVEATPLRSGATLLVQILAVAGMVLTLTPRWRHMVWLPIGFLLLELPAAFLYDRQILEAYRHTYHALPLVVFAAAFVVHALLSRQRSPGPAVTATT